MQFILRIAAYVCSNCSLPESSVACISACGVGGVVIEAA